MTISLVIKLSFVSPGSRVLFVVLPSPWLKLAPPMYLEMRAMMAVSAASE
ncbi:uncharacterized protein DS421_2g53430 [Arachis hypogaea]|nr:uncharacterized protein DS421_2g53430 [Arachis hypogaea]